MRTAGVHRDKQAGPMERQRAAFPTSHNSDLRQHHPPRTSSHNNLPSTVTPHDVPLQAPAYHLHLQSTEAQTKKEREPWHTAPTLAPKQRPRPAAPQAGALLLAAFTATSSGHFSLQDTCYRGTCATMWVTKDTPHQSQLHHSLAGSAGSLLMAVSHRQEDRPQETPGTVPAEQSKLHKGCCAGYHYYFTLGVSHDG